MKMESLGAAGGTLIAGKCVAWGAAGVAAGGTAFALPLTASLMVGAAAGVGVVRIAKGCKEQIERRRANMVHSDNKGEE